MRYLLDTSALLAHYRQEYGWKQVQALFEDGSAEVFVAGPSLTEFARRLDSLGVALNAIRTTVESYRLLFAETLVIDALTALTAFEVMRETPDRLPLIDALIAATAWVNDAVLVHRDTHMTAIPPELVQQQVLN